MSICQVKQKIPYMNMKDAITFEEITGNLMTVGTRVNIFFPFKINTKAKTNLNMHTFKCFHKLILVYETHACKQTILGVLWAMEDRRNARLI